MVVIFKRKVLDCLREWKTTEKGRSAVLLEGARRVGKTTVAIQFGKLEYESYILIDFAAITNDILDLFESFSNNLDDFFIRLEVISGKKLVIRNSLIIFDEVQLYPKARQMIKRLVADGRYDYLETGSLISVRTNVKSILIPSEEYSIAMSPMDFEEFLWALGSEVDAEYIRRCYDSRTSLGRSVHELLMRRFRMYMIIGGMPQVVERFLSDNSLSGIETVKRSILKLYRSDMMKLPTSVSERALKLFDAIPSLLSSKKRFISPSKIAKGSRMRDYDRAIAWLSEAKIVNLCRRQTDPSILSGSDIDESRLKPYLLDTGLLISMSFGNDKRDMSDIYNDLLGGKLSINEGMFFENVVAQELVSQGYRLIFSEFHVKDSTKMYEIDFIIPDRGKIVPIEVKSSMSSRHTSIDRFCEKYHSRIKGPIVVHPKDLRFDGTCLYIPAYMVFAL